MKSVGLVGGLGPESTIDYYRRILAGWAAQSPGDAPSLVIDSLDVQRGLRLAASDLPGLTTYLAESVHRLAAAGVDFVALTANTAHIVFDEVERASPVPLVSIVDVCADAAQSRGFTRPLLLGTRFTMEGGFYQTVFGRRGLDIVTPGADDRTWLHERYVAELLRGDFRDETRQRLIALVTAVAADTGADSVILGGTELPLLLKDDVIASLPVLDTTALHVQAIVARLLA